MTAVEDAEQVQGRIDARELVDLALALGNVHSPAGAEGPACDFVFDWMQRHGFAPQKIGAFDDRYNVVGRLKGTGGGRSLAFNSHLDTIFSPDEDLLYLDPRDDLKLKAWEDEGGRVWGWPVVNCKGPMACWLIACKALQEAGVELRGDVLLTAVVGEIDLEPVDEFQGRDYLGEDIGARFMITHGALADFALVAEATSFQVGQVEAGKVFFKITVKAGPSIYNPHLPRQGVPREESRSAIVQMARFVDAFEAWAEDYERRYTLEYEHGTVVPKAVIGAVRAGYPHKIWRAPELCHAYADVRLNPETQPLRVQEELEAVAAELGVEAEIRPYLYRRGYEAQGVEPLRDAVVSAHEAVLGRPVERVQPGTVSMWRDTNPFNELGIPSLTYGPGANTGAGIGHFTTDEMVAAARVYARVALDLCG